MAVQHERRDRVQILTINRPEKRNALDPTTIDEIGQALIDFENDDGLAVLVLTGAGDKAFCAGMDLASFTEGRQNLKGPAAGRYEAFFRTGSPKPTIAAINGSAVGGGFELMLACDLAVAADHARFGLPEVKRGLFAGAGGTLLPKRIPLAIAMEFALIGDLIDVSRIADLGLVNRVVPGPQVLDVAVEMATRIAANGPLAVRTTKSLMWDSLEQPLSAAWRNIEAALPEILVSPDAREGSLAFVERRTPRWPGLG